MADPFRLSDPAMNLQFSKDWGAGRFHERLADEAAKWLKARQNTPPQAPTTKSSPYGRLRSWRAP